ncbi:MAG: DinB family protein [Candidatus Thorarchaeota archaeon]
MNKQQAIQFLKNNHLKLEKVINGLDHNQITEDIISVKWTPKDIINHISAWNLTLKDAIDDLLNDTKPWFINEEELTEAEFNERETRKRKDWSLKQILDEWQISFEELIQRIMRLSKIEWEYQSSFEWAKDMPVTVSSLFDYMYKGEGHEGGHAKQIEEFYKKEC